MSDKVTKAAAMAALSDHFPSRTWLLLWATGDKKTVIKIHRDLGEGVKASPYYYSDHSSH
jgi:hypothetical protein